MLRRLSLLSAVWVVLLGLLASATAAAQESADDDAPDGEVVGYGDAELIEALRKYSLVDEWIAASPVSPQASLLLVSGNGNYQRQRQTFLNSLEAWADRTALVRNQLSRIDAAQANSDRLRSVLAQVRRSLVVDDRLAFGSKTLLEIDDALGQLAAMQFPEHLPGESQAPLVLAELQLKDLRDFATTELLALDAKSAATSTGIAAFVGSQELEIGLNQVDQLLERSRKLITPARQESERLVTSALAQIPNLHAARMVGATDVGGLSVVTVDAYIRAAARSPCSLDWALLAGVGKVESNHGRLGGASVSRSGQVSTTILGPLLDGGATEREIDEARQNEIDRWLLTVVALDAARREAHEAIENALLGALRVFGADLGARVVAADVGVDSIDVNIAGEAEDQGNGFAVVIDSDGGRLDGNDQWDRAIGPMQFLPETWSKWATDGNGDGTADPHNLYDATAAAGRFLCHLQATLGPSPSTFVLGYNNSSSYVRSVLSSAQSLRALALPSV